MSNVIIAVNGAYVDPNTLLEDGDVVALFPPVSGG
jgi:molybdopterin converting factor small subunit